MLHPPLLNFLLLTPPSPPLPSGHVLTLPRRVVPRFSQLSAEEACDLVLLSQRVAAAVEKHYGATSSTLAVQVGGWVGSPPLDSGPADTIPPACPPHPRAHRTAQPYALVRSMGELAGPGSLVRVS